MKKIKFFMLAVVVVLFTACHDKLWDSIEDLDSRVTKLEELCKEMNTNISALQTIVEVIQENDFITGIVPIEKGGEVIGYTITFGKHEPITIYNGEDGKDGQNGANGVDGKDGYTPILGVAKDTDGVYYWTLDGEWLLDDEGNKIRVTGRDGKDGVDGEDGKDGQDGTNGTNGADGKDGVTPQLKIEEGYWYISYDNGATWTELGKAVGEDGKDGTNGTDGKDGQDGKPGADGKDGQNGDSMFTSVTYDDNNVYFTLTDGSVLIVPRGNSSSTGSDFDQTVIDNLVNSLEINKEIILMTNIGDKDTIISTTLPFTNSKVIWTSSDSTIVSVNNGVIEALSEGYVSITIQAATLIKICKVYVVPIRVRSISVSDTSKVIFASGNLQYNANQEIWRFAEKPYETLGMYNNLRSQLYDGWIDLFSLGCNGYEYKPYEEGKFYYRPNISYGNVSVPIEELCKTNYDFGWYNKISNGGNQIQMWRMITNKEFKYLLETRDNANKLKTFATFNNVQGLILFPDEFQVPSIMKLIINSLSFEENVIDDAMWNILSAYGATFFPLTGYYSFYKNSYFPNIQSYLSNEVKAYYWTSTFCDIPYSNYLQHLTFYDGNCKLSNFSRPFEYECSTYSGGEDHRYAFAVRLVKDVK